MGCGNSKIMAKDDSSNEKTKETKVKIEDNNNKSFLTKKSLKSVRTIRKQRTLVKHNTQIEDLELEVSYLKQGELDQFSQRASNRNTNQVASNGSHKKIKVKMTKIETDTGCFDYNVQNSLIEIREREREESTWSIRDGENADKNNISQSKKNVSRNNNALNGISSNNGTQKNLTNNDKNKSTKLKSSKKLEPKILLRNIDITRITNDLLREVDSNKITTTFKAASNLVDINNKTLNNTDNPNPNTNNYNKDNENLSKSRFKRSDKSIKEKKVAINETNRTNTSKENTSNKQNRRESSQVENLDLEEFMPFNILVNDKSNKSKKLDIKSIINKKKNKNMSILDNLEIKSLNYSALRIKKYYLNQKPFSLSKNNKKFVDDLFPPNINSLVGKNPNGEIIDKASSRYEKNLNKLQVKVDDVVWLRPEEFFPGGKYTIFEGSIDIDDVNQGNLGNCYFLSAIAAMCEYPQMISELFRQFTINNHGYYEVVFNLNGVWKVVIVDDYFPCLKSNKNPIFSKPKNSELWVLILEKAWAKVNGGYVNIIGGWPCEVLKAVTPFCNKSYNNNDYQEELFNIILDADQKGYIMACSSIFEPSIERKGIISGHAFTIISAHEAWIRNKLVRLLRIRNPWGYQEWNGPWSDGSPEWDYDAKKAFGEYINQDDGTFFIEYSDYIENFLETQICRVMSPSCTKSIVIPKSRLFVGNIYEMLLNKPSIVDISVIQKTFRFHRSIPENSEMTINILLLKKNKDNSIDIIKIEGDNNNDPVLDTYLSAGTYFIYILCNRESYIYDRERTVRLYIVSNNYYLLNDKGVDKNYSFLMDTIKQKCKELPVEDSLITITKNKIADRSTIGMFYLKNCSGNEKTFKIINEVQNFSLINNFTTLHDAISEEEYNENMIQNTLNSINNQNNNSNNRIMKMLSKKMSKLGTLTKISPTKKYDNKSTYLSFNSNYNNNYNSNYNNNTTMKNLNIVKAESFCDDGLTSNSNNNNRVFNTEKNNYLLTSNKSIMLYNSFNDTLSKQFLITLGSEEDILILGQRNYYYEEYWFNISFEEATLKDKDLKTYKENIDTNFNYSIIRDNQIDEEFLIRPDLESFDYFFKRHDIDVNSKLAVKIDDTDISLEYFTCKYPQFMNILKQLEPLPAKELKFMDIFDSGYGIYFGEWKVSKTNVIPIKYGRGLTIFEDGSKHVGYYKNDEFNGTGQFIYKDGSKITINFIDGKMHGEGVHIKSDIEKKVVYDNGCYVK